MSRLNRDFESIEAEIFDYGPVVIFKWKNEPGWPVEFVSGNVGLNFGYTANQFMSGKISYEKIIHPLDLPIVEKEVKEHTDNNLLTIDHKPYRILNGKGEVRWVSDTTTIVKEANEIIGFLGYIVDITDQILKEQMLDEIKDRYDHLLNATEEGVWDWDLRTDEVFFSKRWKEMLGFQDYEIHGSLLEWEKRVHKDDIEGCYADIKAHLDGETRIYENIHRVLHKDGHYLWILDRGIKILDKHGEAYRMIGTHKDITEERELTDKLQKLAREDSLTNLNNRRAFYEIAMQEIERSNRYENPLTLLMLDIDHFKIVNDTWGHNFGDQVLKEMADIFKECVREIDYVFRLGGEEFGIILPETNESNGELLAERIREMISGIEFNAGHEAVTNITISIGVAEYEEPLNIDELMECADKALYYSKENGRNMSSCYSKIG